MSSRNWDPLLTELRTQLERVEEAISAIEEPAEFRSRQGASEAVPLGFPTPLAPTDSGFPTTPPEGTHPMIFLRLIWFLCLAAVIVGSLAPAQSPVVGLIEQAHVNDKIEHFTAYAVLAALPALQRFRCRRLRTTLLFLFLLGGALEIGQLFSPGRTATGTTSSRTPAAFWLVWH
jgi:hypothetical protein